MPKQSLGDGKLTGKAKLPQSFYTHDEDVRHQEEEQGGIQDFRAFDFTPAGLHQAGEKQRTPLGLCWHQVTIEEEEEEHRQRDQQNPFRGAGGWDLVHVGRCQDSREPPEYQRAQRSR